VIPAVLNKSKNKDKPQKSRCIRSKKEFNEIPESKACNEKHPKRTKFVKPTFNTKEVR